MELPGNWQKIVRTISEKVQQMNLQLYASEQESWVKPSRYWRDYISCFEYMLDSDIPMACFKRLRQHTYHFTGSIPAQYFDVCDADRVNLDLILAQYNELKSALPERYHLSEPRLLGGFGVDVDGCLINIDVVRFMAAFLVLSQSGMLDDINARDNAKILEIGGGFGGLCHHLINSAAPKCQYFVIDFPESILFSSAYVSLLNPDKKIYVYDENTYQEAHNGDFAGYDCIFLPNWIFKGLKEDFFDLVINQASLQEMTDEQVEVYLDGIVKICKGKFYSFNCDFQNHNRELKGLFVELEKRFECQEFFPNSTSSPDLGKWFRARFAGEFKRLCSAVGWRLKHYFKKRKRSRFVNPAHIIAKPLSSIKIL